MSEIAKKYINKAIHIYDRIPDLQRLAIQKSASFGSLSNFSKIIEENTEIINEFKHISDDICQIIDSGNLNTSGISTKFNQIQTVNQRASQVKTKVNETKRFLTNEQVTEYVKLIEDCFNNLTFSSIDKYETKLVNANRQLLDFIDQLKAVNDLASRVKTNIGEIKRLIDKHQNEVAEFEKLIEDYFNNMSFVTLDNYKTELENANKQLLKLLRERIAKYQDCIVIECNHIVGLKVDGTVVAIGKNTESWQNIVAISAGPHHIVGLKADGTVVSVGGGRDTENWRNIIAISAYYHTVGLKADGTVVAVGNNQDGQCETGSWKDIIAISTGNCHTVGLKADGTVVAVGGRVNNYVQCKTGSWKDIISITTGGYLTVGLKADGTVVAVGDNKNGQCNTRNWKDIVAIFTDSWASHTVGLKSDGKVVAVGNNDYGQCKIESWEDIVSISTVGSVWGVTIGLKADGTVVAVGKNERGQCNTSSWRDIVAISADDNLTVGLKANGTVVEAGSKYIYSERYSAKSWRNIGPVPEEQVLKWKQSLQWQKEGLCRHCGGKFSGLFSKKCTVCNKPKDY